MWLAEVKAKAKRKNQILFSKDSLLLTDLCQLIAQANRRALILWALELAGKTTWELAEKYPEDHRPQEAIAASRAWAAGEIKMPIAKQAILNCHAMTKELNNPADIARCHTGDTLVRVQPYEPHCRPAPPHDTGQGRRDCLTLLPWRDSLGSPVWQWAF